MVVETINKEVPFIIAKVNDQEFALDVGLLKTDILGINYLRLAKREESGMYTIKNQRRTKYGGGKIDYQFIPVYLAGLLKQEEWIDAENARYLLIKRTESGIPRFFKDKNGKFEELHFSLALIVNSMPEFRKFSSENLKNTPSKITPKSLNANDKIIPIIDVRHGLEQFTEEFGNIYPELREYYPFDEMFKYGVRK